MEADETVEAVEVNRPGGTAPNCAPTQVAIARIGDLGEYIHSLLKPVLHVVYVLASNRMNIFSSPEAFYDRGSP